MRFFKFLIINIVYWYNFHMPVHKSAMRYLSHPFPLLYDENSRILILGSFPSVKAVADGYYYANPHNRFYKVMSAILGVNLVDVQWEEKKQLLLKHRIALHDSIGYCHIYGSSDAKISNVQPSDLHTIFRNAKIEKVICNGAKAYQEYMRFFQNVNIPVASAPSTSPANAKIRLDDLIAAWRKEIADILELE